MGTEKFNILLAEDDVNLSFLLKSNLEEEGYKLWCYDNGIDSWNAFGNGHFDLCIFDVMLPRQDGFNLAKMVRSKNTTIPILFLTARTLKEDIYHGFEIGADDYITKPFTMRELLLRIKAVLRRTSHQKQIPASGYVFSIGNLRFNYNTRQVTAGSEVKKLSTKENELLRIFCENKNMVINRNRLLLEVWGNDDYFVSKSLDVYITKLRKLLNGDKQVSIQNYHSIGYKLIEG